jgi:hypothetical protein
MLAGFFSAGKSDFTCESGFTRTPSVGAESTTTADAPSPRARSSCVSVPPNECPMMIGGFGSASICAAMWSTVSGTVRFAMISGFSRSASTSISKPG